MKEKIRFPQVGSIEAIQDLRKEMYNTLIAPMDGMWDHLIHHESEIRVIKQGPEELGYFCRQGKKLVNFYLRVREEAFSRHIFQTLLDQQFCESALAGTNHPFFVSLAIARGESYRMHTLLYKDNGSLNIPPVDLKGIPTLEKVDLEDLERAVNFYYHNTTSQEDWLRGYLKNLISRRELYALSDGKEWVGSLEVRLSDTQEGIADLGVITSQKFRRKGIATFLLLRGKEIAYHQKQIPICSTTAGNLAARRTIERAGFFPWHRMIDISFGPEKIVAVG